jgi:hypothetical protein
MRYTYFYSYRCQFTQGRVFAQQAGEMQGNGLAVLPWPMDTMEKIQHIEAEVRRAVEAQHPKRKFQSVTLVSVSVMAAAEQSPQESPATNPAPGG